MGRVVNPFARLEQIADMQGWLNLKVAASIASGWQWGKAEVAQDANS
jgi:hypothetical protein